MSPFRKAIVAICSTAMMLGTMGVAGASASSAPACVTRAQFIYDFDVAAGIAPTYPASSDFTDVSSSSPYYGYVEAAFKAGIINGTGNGQFDPTGCLTRAQIAKIEVLALGDGTAAASDATQSTTFKDDSSIPSWARGYIVEAVALGLVHGFPDGTFGANQDMTASDEAFFLSQYKTVEVAGTLTVTASATDVAVGQQVTLTATGTNEPVTYQTTSGAIISLSTFIGSQAGNYTVTGTTADGLKGTVAISVYGAPTALKIVTPTASPVANGASSTTISVDVVDANGNIVTGDNSTQITLSGYGVVLTTPTVPGGQETDTNGIAAYAFTNGIVPGATDNLTATATGLTTAQAPVTSTAQVATSISVTAPQYLSVNQAAQANTPFTAEVDDQTGQKMVSQTFGLTASVTGAGSSLDTAGDQTATGAYANGTPAPFTLYGTQGMTGAITITVSGAGLTSGTATTTAVVSGSPAKIVLTPPSTTSFSQDQGTTGIQYGYYVADASGYPVPSSELLAFSALDSSGNAATGDGFNPPVVTNPNSDDSGTITLTDPPGSGLGNAGTYTLQATDDGALGLTASATDSFTVTPGVGTQVALSGPSFIAASSPTATISAQLEDQSGNPVSQAGVTVDFKAIGTGGSSVTVASSATTDSTGVATVTATVPPYTGDTYTIQASGVGSGLPSHPFTVESTIATGVTLTLKDTTRGPNSNGQSVGSFAAATSSDKVQVTVTVADSYGNDPGTADALSLGFGGTGTLGAGTLVTGSSATLTAGTTWTVTTNPAAVIGGKTVDAAVIDAAAILSGPVTVTVKDTADSPSPTATAAMNVATGTIIGATLFYQGAPVSASNPVPVTANTPVALTLTPTDANGNAGVQPTATTVYLTDPNGGSFRLTPGGSDVTAVPVPAGSAGVSVYYVNATPGNDSGMGSALPGPTTLLATTPAGGMAGGNFTFTLTVKDQQGNTLTSYGSTDNVTVTWGSQSLNTTATFTGGVSAPITPQLTDAQTGTLSVTDTSLAPNLTGTTTSFTVAVNVPDSTNSTLAPAAGPYIAGTPTTYTLTLEDAYGNPITGDTAGIAMPTPPTVTTGTSGTVNFGAVSETGTTDQYTFTATDTTAETLQFFLTPMGGAGPANGPILSSSITVAVNVPNSAKSSLSPAVGPYIAGTPTTYTLTLEDAYGNPITGDTAGITMPPTVTTGTSGTVSFGAVSETGTTDQYTFTATDTKAENLQFSLTTTDGAGPANGPIQSSSITVAVNVPDSTKSSLIPATGSYIAGTPTTYTLTLEDAYGNPITGDTAGITMPPTVTTGTSGTVSFGAVSETGTTDQYTFTATDTKAENLQFSLTPTDAAGPANGPIQSSSITVAAGPFAQWSVVLSQSPDQVVITEQDQYGNTVTTVPTVYVTYTNDDITDGPPSDDTLGYLTGPGPANTNVPANGSSGTAVTLPTGTGTVTLTWTKAIDSEADADTFNDFVFVSQTSGGGGITGVSSPQSY